jgi:tight adherence protein C
VSGSYLLIGGVGAFGLGIALLVVGTLWSKSRATGVVGAMASIERHYRQQSVGAHSDRSSRRATELPTWARRLAQRLSPAGVSSSLQRRLDLAGNSGNWTPDRILAVKGIGLVVGAIVGVLIGLHRPTLVIVWAAALGAIGFFLPDVLLYNSGIKRQALIVSALPDALDMLTVCVEAGLGFDSAMAQVARNMTGPLAEEFARALQEMQIGLSRSQALRGMVARTTVPELRSFVSSLVQAAELGIPVARVLREQAAEMRVVRRQRAEERAQKVTVKIMFPVVLCLFPALLVIIIGPGVISIAHALFGI